MQKPARKYCAVVKGKELKEGVGCIELLLPLGRRGRRDAIGNNTSSSSACYSIV